MKGIAFAGGRSRDEGDDMKPEPEYDDYGIPFCRTWCARYAACRGAIPGATCLPVLRDIAASEKRHREPWAWLDKRPWLSVCYDDAYDSWGVLSDRDGEGWLAHGFVSLEAVEDAMRRKP